MGIFDFIINRPMGFILGAIYNFVQSYGLSIILFTLVMKIILLPISIKQQKSMASTARIQPKIKELEKKYRGDKQKQSEEMMKLYKEEGVNPMSGCLPMLIQFPIIIGLYSVVNRPLTYLLQMTSEQVMEIVHALGLGYAGNEMGMEIFVAEAMRNNVSLIPESLRQISLIDFNFLGLNLAAAPSVMEPGILWIIPILAGLTAFVSSKITAKSNPAAAGNEQTAAMTKSMTFTMPLISLWITFTLPAGVGLYWITSNILMTVQQYLLNKAIPMSPPEQNSKKGDRKND